MFYQHSVIFLYIILTKACNILYYWRHNVCMLVVTDFIAVFLK